MNDGKTARILAFRRRGQVYESAPVLDPKRSGHRETACHRHPPRAETQPETGKVRELAKTDTDPAALLPQKRMSPKVRSGAPRSDRDQGASWNGRPKSARLAADVTPLRRPKGGRVRYARRPPVLRLAKIFFLALLIVGGPLGLAALVFRSPAFALDEVDVRIEGRGRVSEEWIRSSLETAEGWNLPLLPLPWVDDVLKRHPWVKAAAIRKELPRRLTIRVIEKREAALLRLSEGAASFPAGAREKRYWYLDDEGATIAPFNPARTSADLPLVSATSSELELGPALAIKEEIEAVAPDWAAGLSEIEVLGKDDFRVWTAELPFSLLVRAGALRDKTAYMKEILPEVRRQYKSIEAVDLRFARRIILQPSVRGSATSIPGVHERGLGG